MLPLTISDFATRFLVNCEALPSTQEATAYRTFEETFKEYGLPRATQPPAFNFLQQQEKFYHFMQEYNFERPHQALAMKCPGELYQKSQTPYRGLPDITYPGYDKTLLVTHCGRICMNNLKIHITKALTNQPVGLRLVDNGIWEVSFKDYDLGYFDEESGKFAPKEDPFGLSLEKAV